jgi:SAM-dependent methyltransferase
MSIEVLIITLLSLFVVSVALICVAFAIIKEYRACYSGRNYLIGLLLVVVAGLIFLRPHEHTFEGLDTSGYRLMAKAFQEGLQLSCRKWYSSSRSFVATTLRKLFKNKYWNRIREQNLNRKIKLDDSYADTIVSLSVMEHLYKPQNFLNEANRILKKGGYFILQVPWQWWVHEAPYDYFRYTPYGLKYMFEKAGFEILAIEPTGGFFTTWLLKVNYFSLRFIRGPKVLKILIKSMLIPLWTLNQTIAPILDKLDRNKELEAAGYIVFARKKDK